VRLGHHNTHVPDLIRDLHQMRARGPGSSPGRDLRLVNQTTSTLKHGAFCLHHGLPSGGCDLYRANRPAFSAGRFTQARFIKAYGTLQNQNARLVRTTRNVRSQFEARAANQTLASRLEERTDFQNQPTLARYYTPHRQLRWRPRIKSGARPIFCSSRGT